MCEFFIHFLRHIISNNRIAFCDIGSRLKLFQVLRIFFILEIEVDTQNKGILADEMKY